MHATSQTLFEEHRQFHQPWLWGMMLGILVMLLAILGLIVFQGRNEEGSGQAIVGISIGIAVELGVMVLMYTMKLSVRLDSEGLHIGPAQQISRSSTRTSRWTRSSAGRPALTGRSWCMAAGHP